MHAQKGGGKIASLPTFLKHFERRPLKYWPCQYAGGLGPKRGGRRRPATACGRLAGLLGPTPRAPSIEKNNIP